MSASELHHERTEESSFAATLTVVGSNPFTLAVAVDSFRRGGCRCELSVDDLSSGDSPTLAMGLEGVLSLRLDASFVSRPVRIGRTDADATITLLFAPIPTLDDRWRWIIPDVD